MLYCRDAWIPVFNIRILSVSVKNYPYPYPIRSDIVNCYPYPIHICSIDHESKKMTPDIFGCSCNIGCAILIPPRSFWHRCQCCLLPDVCHNY